MKKFNFIWLVILTIFLLFLAVWHSPAKAHEWYAGRSDPVTTKGCCGGSDCAPVPIDADWVQPVASGFRVQLSVKQAQTFNKNIVQPIDAFVPWSRVMVMGSKYNGPPAFYHICLVAPVELRCLFVLPSL